MKIVLLIETLVVLFFLAFSILLTQLMKIVLYNLRALSLSSICINSTIFMQITSTPSTLSSQSRNILLLSSTHASQLFLCFRSFFFSSVCYSADFVVSLCYFPCTQKAAEKSNKAHLLCLITV